MLAVHYICIRGIVFILYDLFIYWILKLFWQCSIFSH
jgi:hypothetical protein